MGHHVFISYRHEEDQRYVRKLADDMRANAIKPWHDEHVEYGDRWWRTIVEKIRTCAAFVVVMTPGSEKSEWVEQEILLAKDEGKLIFPLLLRGKRNPLLGSRQYVDVTGGQMPPKAFYDRLQRALPVAEQVTEQAPEGFRRPRHADSAEPIGLELHEASVFKPAENRALVRIFISPRQRIYLRRRGCSCILTVPGIIDAQQLAVHEFFVSEDSRNVVKTEEDLAIDGSGYFRVDVRASSADATIPKDYKDNVRLLFQCTPEGATQPIFSQEVELTWGEGPGRKTGGDWKYQWALPIAEQMTEQAEKKQSATTTSTHPVKKPIPKDVTYTVIDKHVVPNIKRSLDIRLNRKVTEDVLHSIAMKLKNSDPKSYERTFIVYYLPDMKVNAGGWAITHFTPDLEVRIIGLTVEQEQALKPEADDPSRDVIGTWLDESVIGRKITIFRKAGKLFMDTKYKNGSVDTIELVEKASPRGRRFDYKTDRGNGEYYLINGEGNLQEWDHDGHFLTARKFD